MFQNLKSIPKCLALRALNAYNIKSMSSVNYLNCIIQSVRSSSSIVKEHNDPDMFISDINNPFERKKRVCIACKYKIPLDYKNPRLLSQFVSPYTGLVYDKHITGLCDAQQKRLQTAIQRSRLYGYMPILIKAPQYLKDPKLFDPFKPSRPNPY